jgi:hypothetical protein
MMRRFAVDGLQCVLCDRDVWDVGRYVSAGGIAICDACVEDASRALRRAAARGESEATMPPRFYGSRPYDEAPDEIAAAFDGLFGDGPDKPSLALVLEDAAELAPYLVEAQQRHPNMSVRARVTAVRFVSADRAEVRFKIELGPGGGGLPFEGQAIRRDGRWLVTRETFGKVLARGGVTIPPRSPS